MQTQIWFAIEGTPSEVRSAEPRLRERGGYPAAALEPQPLGSPAEMAEMAEALLERWEV